MAKIERSKAVLPLIEMTVALSVLAICSVITVSLFLYAHFAGEASRDTNSAIMLAQSYAEKLHTGEKFNLDDEIGYNENWEITDSEPVFVMHLALDEQIGKTSSLISGEITVKRLNKYPFLSEERSNLATIPIKVFGLYSNE